MKKIKQPLRYLLLAWLGNRLYSIRRALKNLQYWIDKKGRRGLERELVDAFQSI